MEIVKISITSAIAIILLFLVYSCSSDVNSISDALSREDASLRRCTTKAQCNSDEICENGFCKKISITKCRTKDDCIYPEECIQGVCKQPSDVGVEDVSSLDVITDISSGGRIIPEPALIDFGAMLFGETKKKSLTIKNAGTGDIVIYNYELDPGADTETFSISSSFVKNSVLKPDESFEIEVRCTQTDADPDNTNIIITSSDVGASTLRVPVYNKYKDKPDLGIRYRTIFGVDKSFPAQGDKNEILYDMGNTSLDIGRNVNTVELEIINNADEGIFKIEKVTDFINTRNKFEYKFFSKISNQELSTPLYLSGKESVFLIVAFTATEKSNNDTLDLNIYTNDMDINNDGSESENGLLIIRFSTRAGIFPPTLWTSENFIDFGQVKVLDTSHRQIQICNKGDEDLIIYNTSRVLGSKFTLTPSNIEKVLLSNLCYNIDISFTPLKEEMVEDILQINSNDAENPEYKIGLKGEGISCVKQSDTDEPDDGFIDANCDGIDGEITKGLFVDVQGGSDSNDGSINNPLKTIGAAIAKAGSIPQVKYILVSEGNYYENFSLNKAVGIYGGYSRSNNWSRSDSYKVNIYPSQEGILVSNVSSTLLFDRLNIASRDAADASSSSYGMKIINSSNMKIHKCSIKAGRGANGVAGTNGDNGTSNDPSTAKGKSGTPGCEDSGGILCTTCSKPLGGAGGISACGMNGGKGGDAGRSSNYGQNGEAGIGPSGSGGAGGVGGPPGRGSASPLSTQYGQNGTDGANGSNGAGGSNVGTFAVDGYIATNNGLDGESGKDGAGGGGGGGPSIVIYKGGSSVLNQSGTTFIRGGGGSGGESAGNRGANGISAEIYP
ncbi:MAG: choice-of-anchor D domain-containing protein [Myxococcota bacterium]